MLKKLTSGLMIALGMILMPVINIALDPALEIKAFEEFEGLTLADTVEWDDLNGLTLREVFEEGLNSNYNFQSLTGLSSLFATLNILNNELIVTVSDIDNDHYFLQSLNVYTIVGNKYYCISEIAFLNGPNMAIGTHGTNRSIINVVNYDYTIYSSILESTVISNELIIYHGLQNYEVNDFYKVRYFNAIDLTSLGIDTLTVEQIDYYYQKYIEYKEIKAILTPPLDVDGCDVAAGCYSYFELGRVMFYDGLLSMVPREVNDRISFPIFSNLLSFAKNGTVYLINPLLSFLSDFVPFIKVDNSDVVYTDVYHDETWVYNKGSYYETDNHSFYYYNEVLSTKKIWWYWNATESKYIGYDNVDKIYRYYYHTVTFLGSGYWTQSKLAISSEEMRKYNVTYGWKE